MDLKILYEDIDVLAVDKPAGIVVFPESTSPGLIDSKAKPYYKTLIDLLIEKYPKLGDVGRPPRYGIVHRLDKDTSGILLVAKSTEGLIFLQKEFSAHTFSSISNSEERESWDEISPTPLGRGGKNSPALEKKLEKKYIALCYGVIKEDSGTIHTLIGRAKGDPRKQAAHSLEYKGKTGLREAITEYKVIERYTSDKGQGTRDKKNEYTLLEVQIKTGRKHQIRCHLAYIHHPVAGDKMYGFKDSSIPENLHRQFLHASYLKITLLNGNIKEFYSDLPEELSKVLKNLSPD